MVMLNVKKRSLWNCFGNVFVLNLTFLSHFGIKISFFLVFYPKINRKDPDEYLWKNHSKVHIFY